MTALALLSHCASRGVKLILEGDRIVLEGPKPARDEVRETIRAVKPEVLALLRAGREVEVRAFYSQTFARLGALYGDDLIGNLWPAIVAEHPALARAIDTAEQSADAAALAYQQGTAPDSSQFLACLQTWERAWAEAIERVTNTSRACDDCGRTDATVTVETDTGRFCRRCLRPAPLNPKGAHA